MSSTTGKRADAAATSMPAPQAQAAGEAKVEPRFTMEHPAFVDFGCGSGNSMKFAEGIMRGPGVGLDVSPAAVEACIAKGYEAHLGSVLDFETRSVAQATFAVESLPELPGRRDFEKACINMIRAARDFTVIQHVSFDFDEMLMARGAFAPPSYAKNVRFKPRISDYVHLVATHRVSLNIVGLAVFGTGDPVTSPIELPGLSAGVFAGIPGARPYRSIRVIIGRKDIARFRTALHRAGTGDALVSWEATD